jgi:8-oxo-dGTP pyrophosphatase MutT (NUDIX family)
VLWLPGRAPVELLWLGEWSGSGRIVLGLPAVAGEGADELRRWAATRHVPVAATLTATVDHALDLLPPASRRVGGERDVPLSVWNTSSFQGWYSSQRGARNALLGVSRVWTFRVGAGRRRVVVWALEPRIRVAAEGRVMSSEVVFGRNDASALLLYRRADRAADTEVVLVRDFRPAARTPDAYVWELPSGSGDGEPPAIVARREFEEETGLEIELGRLRYHGAHQVWATGAAHVVHMYSVEATAAEIDYMRSQRGVAHGIHEEEEFTYPEVVTWGDILGSPCVDWATRGMVAQVIFAPAEERRI